MELAFDQALQAYQQAFSFLRAQPLKGKLVRWENLEKNLRNIGIKQELRQAILASLVDAVEVRVQNPIPLRTLHLVEKDILSSEGYGLILEGLRFGLIQIQHVESLLEELAGQESLPISAAAIERTLARRWRYHLRKFSVH